MPYFRDRVKDTSTTGGTGDITLSGVAPTGYQTFNNAFGVGPAFLYCIEEPSTGLWETGTGTLSGATTLVRDAYVFDGSSGPGVLVNFTAATAKNVFCTITGHWCEDGDSGALVNKSRGFAML